MKSYRLVIIALSVMLFSAANVALADSFAPVEDDSVSACGIGKGAECASKTVEACTVWVIVELKIGTTTSTSRECKEKVTTTTKQYYTT
jgi:hypothetical protein